MAISVRAENRPVHGLCQLRIPGICRADRQPQLLSFYTLDHDRPIAACSACAQHQLETGEWTLTRPRGRHALRNYVTSYNEADAPQQKLAIARQYTATHHAIWSLDVVHTDGAMHDQWWIQQQDVRDLGQVRVALPADLRQSLPFTAYVRPPMTSDEVITTRAAHFLFVRHTPVDVIAHDEDYALQVVRAEDGAISYRALLMAPTDEEQVAYQWSGRAVPPYPRILVTFRRWSGAMRRLHYRAVHMIDADHVIAEERSGSAEGHTYAILERRWGRWQVAAECGVAPSMEAGIRRGMLGWPSRDDTA